MILHPNHGQIIRLHYRKQLREDAPHGMYGEVLVVGDGPGPLNVLVILESGDRVVVPRGNLMEV